jgi:hypothetical protein
MRLPDESRAPAFKGRSDGKRSTSATAFGDYFPPPGDKRPALHREAK